METSFESANDESESQVDDDGDGASDETKDPSSQEREVTWLTDDEVVSSEEEVELLPGDPEENSGTVLEDVVDGMDREVADDAPGDVTGDGPTESPRGSQMVREAGREVRRSTRTNLGAPPKNQVVLFRHDGYRVVYLCLR